MTRLSENDLAALESELSAHDPWLYATSRALPPTSRAGWVAFLAFVRAARAGVDAEAQRSADDLADRVEAAFSGRPGPFALDRAVAWLVREHDLPRACFDAVLDAARWDLDARRHHTIHRLVDYAVRRTGSVAVAGAVLMGRRKRAPVERAIDLGVALELTRVARDVGRDAKRGRLYLPIEWLEDVGVDPDRLLARPALDATLVPVMARLGSEAERFYLRADPGIALAPIGYRTLIRLARRQGASTLAELERAGWLPGAGPRPFVDRWRDRVAIAAFSLRPSPAERRTTPSPTLEEARWLIDAVAR